nr:pilus assembly protein TadG-related protein [Streptomyces cavernae]
MSSDRGQTLPIYIWVTGILLFVAFAFFAFAQAASARNGAQSAADAAALAAAQSARDDLMDGLETALIGADDTWLDWLDGDPDVGDGATAAAQDLAAQNDATVLGGAVPTNLGGFPGYEVAIETNYKVGDTIIPGTEDQSATADAAAVIEPRCDVPPGADPTQLVTLDCNGQPVDIDPVDFNPADLPDASVLFSVYLAE